MRSQKGVLEQATMETKGWGSRVCLCSFHCEDPSFMVPRSPLVGGTEGVPRSPFLPNAFSFTATGQWGPLHGCTQRPCRRSCSGASWPRSYSSSSGLWRTTGAISCVSRSSQPSAWACLQTVPTVRVPSCRQRAGNMLCLSGGVKSPLAARTSPQCLDGRARALGLRLGMLSCVPY